MHEMNLNLHGLVKVWAPEVTDEVYYGMRKFLGHFFVEEKTQLESLDILLLPLASAKLKESLNNLSPSPYGMSFVEHHGDKGIVFNYKGVPDQVLILEDKITIYYTPRKKNLHRIYGLLLFSINLVLHQKDGLLYHGAGAVNGDTALLLTGLRGSKKTQLLMTLLQHEWHYISDDKLLLYNGTMYMFQDVIPIADHHLSSLPWLYDNLPKKVQRRKSVWRRTMRMQIAAFSRRWLSKHVLPLMEKVYDPQLLLNTLDMFPNCQLVSSASPSAVVLLSLGDKISCEQLEPDQATLEEIAAIQSLVFYSMGPLEQLVFFCNRSFTIPVGDIIRRNFSSGYPFFRLTIPGSADMEDVYKTLEKHIVGKF